MSHPVIKHLQQIHHVRFSRAFDDWLALQLAAYCKDEEAYMGFMKRYGPREEGKEHPADHFAKALGALKLAMIESDKRGEVRDHLGEIYEEQAAQNKEMGQFFTPMELCTLMADLTMPNDLPECATINDPACGSGRSLIAASKKRPNGVFYGTDLDITCARMATLNMLYRNLDSYIIHGDTLRLQAHGGWMTRNTALGGVVKPLTQEQAQRLIESSFKAIQRGQDKLVTTPDMQAEADRIKRDFEANTKGQLGFGF